MDEKQLALLEAFREMNQAIDRMAAALTAVYGAWAADLSTRLDELYSVLHPFILYCRRETLRLYLTGWLPARIVAAIVDRCPEKWLPTIDADRLAAHFQEEREGEWEELP